MNEQQLQELAEKHLKKLEENRSLPSDRAIGIIEGFIAGYKASQEDKEQDAVSLISFVRNLEYMNGTKPQYAFSNEEILEEYLKQKQ
jgi:hypothetical protein